MPWLHRWRRQASVGSVMVVFSANTLLTSVKPYQKWTQPWFALFHKVQDVRLILFKDPLFLPEPSQVASFVVHLR